MLHNYYFCGNKVIIIMKYAIKTGNVTQVPLLSSITHYLSNEVTVTSVILQRQVMKLLISLVIH